MLDTRRREADLDASERIREAHWLSAVLAEEGFDVPPAATERLLDLHRRYLEAPPPDEVPDVPDDPPPSELAGDDRVGVEGHGADVGQ